MSEKTNSAGSTSRLLQLCFGYFIFYVINGVAVKFFLSTGEGYPALNGMEYLVYNTAGAALLATGVVLVLKWYRIESVRKINIMGISIPSELPYILVSGICT
ncbi:MAG TPA: hypothetical protein PLT70_01645, partial [bacterium]|nr:hypothetical protein [bacterium]